LPRDVMLELKNPAPNQILIEILSSEWS